MKLLFFTLLCLFFGTTSVVAITPAPPALSAKAYVLMDYKSGRIIAEFNADGQVEPASLTKMMTSYVISAEIEQGNISLSDKVVVSENAWAKKFPGSSVMFIEVGKQVSVDDLLKGVIIQSGNDASVALSEHATGSESVFAELMNHYAEKIGLENTHFVNSTGLPHKEHYTTALDMAKLGRALIRDYPKEYQLYKEKNFTFNHIEQPNRNRLLWDRSLQVDGIKTGHTEAAGYCLVSSAVKDNMRLIAVVMGTRNDQIRMNESKKLLTFGFRFFETGRVLDANKEIHSSRVWGGKNEQVKLGVKEDIWITIPRGKKDQLKANYIVDNELEAPLTQGDVVGKIIFQLDDEQYGEYPLLVLEDVARGGLWSRMTDSVSRWFSNLF